MGVGPILAFIAFHNIHDGWAILARHRKRRLCFYGCRILAAGEGAGLDAPPSTSDLGSIRAVLKALDKNSFKQPHDFSQCLAGNC
jgi:hypothetical protein